ncbi:MAG: DUF3168 domain-containing protein [Proteobacteria bacterium]|nr:DUF3168 domain-containing protein [Pseudomonadota bacterium]
MSASLAFQTVARLALIGDPGLTALVPADNVLDVNGRPEADPRVILGEDQELPGDEVVGRYTELFATMHVWSKEPGVKRAKLIVSAMRRVLNGQRWNDGSYRCLDTRFQSARFLRDPDGETTHGVVTFKAVLEQM